MKIRIIFLLVAAALLSACDYHPHIRGKVTKITMEEGTPRVHFDDGRSQLFQDVPEPIVGKDCTIYFSRHNPFRDQITHLDCE